MTTPAPGLTPMDRRLCRTLRSARDFTYRATAEPVYDGPYGSAVRIRPHSTDRPVLDLHIDVYSAMHTAERETRYRVLDLLRCDDPYGRPLTGSMRGATAALTAAIMLAHSAVR